MIPRFATSLTIALSALALLVGSGIAWSATPEPPLLLCEGCPAQGGDNASRISAIVGRYDVPFAYNYPADPQTSREVSVNSAQEFNSAASVAGTRIVVASSFSGDVQISANDIDVVMPNQYTIFGGLSLDPGFSLDRIRWTGGNIDNQGRMMTWRAVDDVLFDDVQILGRVDLHRISGDVGSRRVAFINSTLDARDASEFVDFTFYSHNDLVNEDLILANVVGHNAYNSPIRIQRARRVVVVESAFNPENSSDTGFRFSSGVDQAFVGGRASKPTYIVGRIHLTYVSPVSTAVTNATWDGVVQYRDFNQAFLHLDVPNSGVVRNHTLYSESGAGGSIGSIAPFSAGSGNAPVQAWNGTSLPDVSEYGAQR